MSRSALFAILFYNLQPEQSSKHKQVRCSKDRSRRSMSNHSFANRNLFAYLYESLNVCTIDREHPNNVHSIHYHMAFVIPEYKRVCPKADGVFLQSTHCRLTSYTSTYIAKPTRCTFSQIYLFWNNTLHVSDGLSIIRSSRLYIQQLSNRYCCLLPSKQATISV